MATHQKRILADGSTVHRFIVRRVGAPVRVFQHATKTQARKRARAYEAAIDAGQARAGRETVEDAFRFYEASDEFAKLRTQEARRAHLEWWRPRLAHLPLSDLRAVQRAIQAAKVELRTHGGIGGDPVDEPTVNRYLASLGKVFRVAERDADLGAVLLYNPARKVGRFDESGRNRERIFTDDEFWALLEQTRAADDPRLATMFLMAMSCAARISEIEAIDRRSVNLDSGEIPLRRTKNGRLRVARVTGMALDALRDFIRTHPPHVTGKLFASRRGIPAAPRKQWDAAREAAGASDAGWHTCRHTSLTWYAALGASEFELKEHGGHRSLASLEGYIHRATGVRSEVAALLLPEPAAVRLVRERQALTVAG